MNSKPPESNDRVRITKRKNIFIEDYAENWSREIFIVDSVFKTNPLTYKIKDLNLNLNIFIIYELLSRTR